MSGEEEGRRIRKRLLPTCLLMLFASHKHLISNSILFLKFQSHSGVQLSQTPRDHRLVRGSSSLAMGLQTPLKSFKMLPACWVRSTQVLVRTYTVHVV